MPSSPTSEAPAAFVCDCVDWQRTACNGLPFFKEHDGKLYCVLHYPGKDKVADFDEALKRKLDARDFDFRGVCFPARANFRRFTFATRADFEAATFGAEADFGSATFDAEASFYCTAFDANASFFTATFNAMAYFHSATVTGRADFDSAVFSGEAHFTYAGFGEEANFGAVTFGAVASFRSAVFRTAAVFIGARFGAEADFSSATFDKRAGFAGATFKDFAWFSGEDWVKFLGLYVAGNQVFGDDASFSLSNARIEKPDRVSFDTLTLRPHWFVNVDARKFEFINVEWNWRNLSTKREVESIDDEGSASAHRLLAIACRNLAVNAEENHRYEEASRFRYMAMEARRLERWRGFAFWRLDWWYWLASGYGERAPRAIAVFLVIWLSFAILFSRPEPVRCPADMPSRADCLGWDTKNTSANFLNGFFNAAVYAVETMTLQKPEPRPASPLARLSVLLCAVLGPVQAALLALAIRRKFMR